MDKIVETEDIVTITMRFNRRSWDAIVELANQMQPGSESEVIRRAVGFLSGFYHFFKPEHVLIAVGEDGEEYRIPALVVLEPDSRKWEEQTKESFDFRREWVVRRRSFFKTWWKKLIGEE